VPAGRLEQLAQQLYRVLTDGAPRLRFNIRNGCQFRDAATKKLLLGSWTDEWRAACDVFAGDRREYRQANWMVLLQHLQGKYDVAIQSPSWSSFIVLDIDRPELGEAAGDPLEERLADVRRDAVLGDVWRAYGFSRERQPVILRTPGDGYHLYLPHTRNDERNPQQHPWPLAWLRAHHEHLLDRARRGLKPGVLEMYPSGVPLRAPCGRGMALFVPRNPDAPDDLQLEMRHADWVETTDPRSGARSTVLRRSDIAGFVADFLQRIEAARRPVEEWTQPEPEERRPAWGARYGPFGDRTDGAPGMASTTPYQHIGEVPRSGGGGGPRSGALAGGSVSSGSPAEGQKSASTKVTGLPSSPPLSSSEQEVLEERQVGRGKLLYGSAFRIRIVQLLSGGLASAGERHDAALKLAWYFHVACHLDADATMAAVRAWLTRFEHVSATRSKKQATFVEDTVREVRHYLEVHLRLRGPSAQHGAAANANARRPPRCGRLQPADDVMLAKVPDGARAAARGVLSYLATYADDEGHLPGPVTLSARTLEQLVGQRRVRDPDGSLRRASVVALEELQKLGVLAVHADYSVGRHGRQYTCWYEFGSGVLPTADDELGLVLATRAVEEGIVAVVGGVVDEPPRCRFVSFRTGLVEALSSWWQRMYERRAFTPAEFFDADQRAVLPGPFRDRRGRARPPTAVASASPAITPSPAELGAPVGVDTEPEPGALKGPRARGERPARRSWDTDEVYALRCAVVEAETAGDLPEARRLIAELLGVLRRPKGG